MHDKGQIGHGPNPSTPMVYLLYTIQSSIEIRGTVPNFNEARNKINTTLINNSSNSQVKLLRKNGEMSSPY